MVADLVDQFKEQFKEDRNDSNQNKTPSKSISIFSTTLHPNLTSQLDENGHFLNESSSTGVSHITGSSNSSNDVSVLIIHYNRDAFWSLACLSGLLFVLFAAIYLSKLWKPENQAVPLHIMKAASEQGGDITNMAKSINNSKVERKSSLCGNERNITSSDEFTDMEREGDFQSEKWSEREFIASISRPSLVDEVQKIRNMVSNMQVSSNFKAKLKGVRDKVQIKYSRLNVEDEE